MMLWNVANPGFVTQFSLLQPLVAKRLHDWMLLKDAACYISRTSSSDQMTVPSLCLCSQHGQRMCSFLWVLSAGASYSALFYITPLLQYEVLNKMKLYQ